MADFSIIMPRGGGVLRRMRDRLSAMPPSDARAMTRGAINDMDQIGRYQHQGALAVEAGTEYPDAPDLTPNPLGAASWMPLTRAPVAMDVNRLIYPDEWTYLSHLGSMTPGGGTALLRELRNQNPETGIALNSIPMPNTHRFYQGLGFERPRSRLFEGFDYVLPPGRPFARAHGGAVRAGSRLPQRVEPAWYPENDPRETWSDEPGHPTNYGPRPERPDTDPREQMLQEFMGDVMRAHERDEFPDEFAEGGEIDPQVAQGPQASSDYTLSGEDVLQLLRLYGARGRDPVEFPRFEQPLENIGPEGRRSGEGYYQGERYAEGGGVVAGPPGSLVDEPEFLDWFRGLPWHQEFVERYGEAPDPDDPSYSYRRAYRAGIAPERYEPDAGRYHWPSVTDEGEELKDPSHPTYWMEEFMRQHGRDPNEMDGPFMQGIR